MLRICTSLLFALASVLVVAEVSAREVNKLSQADACSASQKTATDRPAARTSAPPPTARDTKAKPSMHSDSDSTNRLQSPRWHNFLPGMFR
jgi:hypothetical protein